MCQMVRFDLGLAELHAVWFLCNALQTERWTAAAASERLCHIARKYDMTVIIFCIAPWDDQIITSPLLGKHHSGKANKMRPQDFSVQIFLR